MPKAKISRKRKIIYALIVLLILFGGIESVVRIKQWINAPGPRNLNDDPYRNHVYAPDRTWEIKGYQGAIRISINSIGHRDDEILPSKADGLYRIACLGGSTTFGFGATSNAAAYPNVLEELLGKERPDRTFEVLNAGVQGWNLRNSLTNFQLDLEELGFDLVVIMHVNNDLYENGNPRYYADSRAKSPEEIRKNGSTLLSILKHSAAFRECLDRVRRHRIRHHKLSRMTEEGVHAFERNLRWCVTYLRSKGVTPLLCTYPHIFQARREDAVKQWGKDRFEASAKRCPMEYSVFYEGMLHYNEIVRKVAKEEEVVLADLERTFPGNPSVYVDFIHQNDEGHRLKAKLLVDVILEKVLGAH